MQLYSSLGPLNALMRLVTHAGRNVDPVIFVGLALGVFNLYIADLCCSAAVPW